MPIRHEGVLLEKCVLDEKHDQLLFKRHPVLPVNLVRCEVTALIVLESQALQGGHHLYRRVLVANPNILQRRARGAKLAVQPAGWNACLRTPTAEGVNEP